MRLHRFYVPPHTIRLTRNFWVHDKLLIHQWRKVLRFQAGQQLVLFDGEGVERLYEILELSETEAHLNLVTDMQRQLPSKDVYLAWSLLKKDKNDWVLQKATELGVTHFVPLLADRSEKTGFNADRAEKIIIEASEQCGRGDIPVLREPMKPETMLAGLGEKVLFIMCEQGGERPTVPAESESIGLLVGPEGGWSDVERELFAAQKLPQLGLGDFTLRAETAAITAVYSAFNL